MCFTLHVLVKASLFICNKDKKTISNYNLYKHCMYIVYQIKCRKAFKSFPRKKLIHKNICKSNLIKMILMKNQKI